MSESIYADNEVITSHNDASSIVDTVMSERGNDFLSVHSRKSMTNLILHSQKRLENLKNDDEPNIFSSNTTKTTIEAELRPPIVVNHRDDDGARIAETKNLNKLPYKNRNPAI